MFQMLPSILFFLLLSPIYWWIPSSSCSMLFAHGNPGLNFTCSSCIIVISIKSVSCRNSGAAFKVRVLQMLPAAGTGFAPAAGFGWYVALLAEKHWEHWSGLCDGVRLSNAAPSGRCVEVQLRAICRGGGSAAGSRLWRRSLTLHWYNKSYLNFVEKII